MLIAGAERLTVPPVMESFESPSITMVTFVPVTVPPVMLIDASQKKYVPAARFCELPALFTVSPM